MSIKLSPLLVIPLMDIWLSEIFSIGANVEVIFDFGRGAITGRRRAAVVGSGDGHWIPRFPAPAAGLSSRLPPVTSSTSGSLPASVSAASATSTRGGSDSARVALCVHDIMALT